MTQSKIFKINELVDLRLIDGRTYIYVNNKEFLICARLLLNIPIDRIQEANEIKSIDEAAEVFKQSLWQNRIVEGPMARPSRFQNNTITPEEEFKGHCSNIQAFFENGLSTDILASNIAFPLLKKLVNLGYEPAMKVFKEEIVIRFNEGTHNSRMFLYKGGYLNYLKREERQALNIPIPELINEEKRKRKKRREKMEMKLREELQRNKLRGMKILEESRKEQKARKEQIAVLAQYYNREWLKEKFGENHKLFETLQEKLEEWEENKKPKSIHVLKSKIHELQLELRKIYLELEQLEDNSEQLEDIDKKLEKLYKTKSRFWMINREIDALTAEVKRLQEVELRFEMIKKKKKKKWTNWEVTLKDKIQKKKEEYENLLERKNKDEYIDDLIKQYGNAMNELRTEKKSDWKSGKSDWRSGKKNT